MLSRGIFRAQIGSERGKRARWMAETRLMPKVGQIALTRNTLLNEPVAALADRDSTRTDILHEYFVPRIASMIFSPPAARSFRLTGRTCST